jgi:polar amino acid transport system substrate-binding protein
VLSKLTTGAAARQFGGLDLVFRNLAIALVLPALLADLGPAQAQSAPDARIADLVRSGEVRVGLFSTQYTQDSATGELKGVRVDIARALAARIGVQAKVLAYRTPADVVQCLAGSACDLVFLPFDERSAGVGDFSFPIIQSEYTILIPAGSSIGSLADADRPGIRIAAVRNHASAMTLAGQIRQAEIVLGENELAAFALLRAGRADAFASTRHFLRKISPALPGSHVLHESYGANLNRIVVPKGHAGWLAYVNEFVEQAKASGLVQQAIDRVDGGAFEVAPPGDAGQETLPPPLSSPSAH